MLTSVSDWLEEVSSEEYIWYVKRLSGNDTLANGSHQAGPYIPRDFIFDIFPSIAERREDENPDKWFDLYVDSHCDYQNVRAVWYNGKLRGKTRNEARITNFGGRDSPILDPDSTGALTVFAFLRDESGEAQVCRVWVSRHETEEDIIENVVGPIDPGSWTVWPTQPILFAKKVKSARRAPCWLNSDEIPADWLLNFPTGAQIINKSKELFPGTSLNVDTRIIKRRICEYELFRSIEEASELPHILRGFGNVEDFLSKAQSILQRRKSRSGRSLELHAMEIFVEEGLTNGVDFSHQPTSEDDKKPDFLFPSVGDYQNPSFPDNKLRMLAVKTTCKDRWRQILNEANRIGVKHLLTLQEGVSQNQFKEMQNENVQLVVPSPVISKYHEKIQPHLQTLESFIGDVRILKL